MSCLEHRVKRVSSSGQSVGTETKCCTSDDSMMFLRAKKIIEAAISLGSAWRRNVADLATTMSDKLKASVVSALDSSYLSNL